MRSIFRQVQAVLAISWKSVLFPPLATGISVDLKRQLAPSPMTAVSQRLSLHRSPAHPINQSINQPTNQPTNRHWVYTPNHPISQRSSYPIVIMTTIIIMELEPTEELLLSWSPRRHPGQRLPTVLCLPSSSPHPLAWSLLPSLLLPHPETRKNRQQIKYY